MNRGLTAYKEFVEVYTVCSTEKRNLLNMLKEKEEAFLNARPNIKRDEWELGRVAFQNEQKYGAATWYEWSRQSWRTKWNAFNAEIAEDNTIKFYTAWSRAMPVVQRLAEDFSDINFEYGWADEDLGVNVGMAKFENGVVVSDEFFNEQSKEAYELAVELWRLDLAEEGLVFDEKKQTYEYRDEQYESPNMS